MSFFQVRINVRLTKAELDKAETIFLQNQDKYESLSHYLRSAIIYFNTKNKGG